MQKFVWAYISEYVFNMVYIIYVSARAKLPFTKYPEPFNCLPQLPLAAGAESSLKFYIEK